MTSSDRSTSTHEKALAALARLSKRDPPRHPSKRTPYQESRHNLADRVEKALKEAGLRTWGFLFIDAPIEMIPTGPNF